MARGWESKSVEAQIDDAVAHHSAKPKRTANPDDLAVVRKRESLLLSRTRVVREMEAAQNPRYRALMEKALEVLDAQLAALSPTATCR